MKRTDGRLTGSLTVEACDRILKEQGFRVVTPDEQKEFDRFLK